MAFGLCACAPSNQPQLIDPAQPEQTFPGPEEPCDKVYTFSGSEILALSKQAGKE